jgi:hypothetical protein
MENIYATKWFSLWNYFQCSTQFKLTCANLVGCSFSLKTIATSFGDKEGAMYYNGCHNHIFFKSSTIFETPFGNNDGYSKFEIKYL